MNSREIRNTFLEFFRIKEHKIVDSAPVVPHGDPTLLFTNAGMNQFKDVFLGEGKREYTRAVDTQKCIRVSGKHNDLEEVGVDTYHHTFFEMLGNWSFGDYYKKEAIGWAWELLTEVWKLPKDRLYATVYRTDDEAFDIWKQYLPESNILRFDEKDNFWEMGETGPCGPCSEIHFDGTPDKSGRELVNAGSPDVIEIWNLVFIQYNRKADGTLSELSAKHVDTGMGFERITRVLQGKNSNYDTDIFMPLIQEIEIITKQKYSTDLDNEIGIAMRVIADHIRTLSFAIADGALPGNEGRSYVLRRILRRASRYAKKLGANKPMLFMLVPKLIEIMGDVFPEITTQKEIITKVIKGEEESFLQTLESGINKFEEIVSNQENSQQKIINGDEAFLLYDSFGFPLDLTELMAKDIGFKVDIEGFNQNMKEQKQRSRSARKVILQEADSNKFNYNTDFVGYEKLESESKILFVEENKIILENTPFYVESGGQVSDTGIITFGGEKYFVEDVRKFGNSYVHFCDRELENSIGDIALLQVDKLRRKQIARNHSATHLMHEALRMTLGTHIQQQGSMVNDLNLRFDFNHFEKVDKSTIKDIEDIVNTKILENHIVKTNILSIEEAKKNSKIKMYFGDKYGDTVRAVVIDEKFSIELCGGTHINNSSEIGFFKITTETAIASGVRRIEAITGNAIQNYVYMLNDKITEKGENINELQDKINKLDKRINELVVIELANNLEKLIENSTKINDIDVIIGKFENVEANNLRDLGEKLRDKTKNSVCLIVSIVEDKISIVCTVSDDLISKYNAGKIVSLAAKVIGGGGGGKPHLAQAGGKDLNKVDQLIKNDFFQIIREY